MISLAAGAASELAKITAAQLSLLFPDEDAPSDVTRIVDLLPATLDRLAAILSAARSFETNRFNHRHSMQYATYLYLLGNQAARAGHPVAFCERTFCLNRALHGLDLFYALTLPEVFLISHGVGLVLGATSYGERLVVSQNVTVGRVGDARPTIGARVVLFPGAVVSGHSTVGDDAVIAAGTIVHNIDVPPNSIAFPGPGGPVLRARKRDINSLFLISKSANT